MTDLVLIATAFQPPPEDAAAHSRRLPQLELLLSRARRRSLPARWREWLADRVASPQLAKLSPAAIAQLAFQPRAMAAPGDTGRWLATPVHLFAGLDSLHLHPAGLLQLTAAEQTALAADFADVFRDSPWRLETLARRELLLSGPAIAADGLDPATLLGADPTPGLPRGEGAGQLRRLGSEIEMWLHGHVLNRAREARGELPVTSLWPWGGGSPLTSSHSNRLHQPQLHGSDVYADALWQLMRLQAIELVPNRIASDTVLLMEQLSQFEQPIAQSLHAVRRHRLSLHLIAGAHWFSLSSWQLLQWWRQPRPWWEVLS